MKRYRVAHCGLNTAIIYGLLLSLFIAINANSAELSETWTSVRALGMGNAYTAVVDDSDALFYNPAGLARMTGYYWTVFDPRVGLNGLETINELQKFTSDDEDFAQKLDGLYGKPIWAGGGSKTAISLPGFAIAGFASADAGALLSNPVYPNLNLNYFFDYGVALGFGFDVVPEFVKIGFVGRRINRTGTTLPVGPEVLATLETSQLESELKRRGTGYGLDAGFVMTVPAPIQPSFSFVVKNIGTTHFVHEEGIGAPPPIDTEMILGAALEVPLPLITITPSFDYKYLNKTTLQPGKKLHVGIEVSLPLIDLRAGLHQGYYTLGVGVNLGILRLDAATYGVELGEFPGQHQDRRYIAQLTFELGFDPGRFGSFGFGSSGGTGGGRSRLKQRR